MLHRRIVSRGRLRAVSLANREPCLVKAFFERVPNSAENPVVCLQALGRFAGSCRRDWVFSFLGDMGVRALAELSPCQLSIQFNSILPGGRPARAARPALAFPIATLARCFSRKLKCA